MTERNGPGGRFEPTTLATHYMMADGIVVEDNNSGY